MEQALDQLPPSGLEEDNLPPDSRPAEIVVAEVLDELAVVLARRLKLTIQNTGLLKADDLKTYSETFKMLRDWLVARKKVKKGDEPEDDAAIESAKNAFDKLTKKTTPPKYGEAIHGVKPPEKKIGKPTNEAREQKKEYDRLYKKTVEKFELEDDSELNAKLKAVGVA